MIIKGDFRVEPANLEKKNPKFVRVKHEKKKKQNMNLEYDKMPVATYFNKKYRSLKFEKVLLGGPP